MTTPPSNYPGSNFSYYVVSGGHVKDPAPDQSGNMRAFCPYKHGNNIDYTKIPFVTMLTAPNMQDQEETSFPPDPGTTIVAVNTTGEPSSIVAMAGVKEINQSQSAAGNVDLVSYLSGFQKAMNETVQKIVSKGYQEKQERGALRRVPKDGEEWAHKLTKGLPTHAALAPLAGTKLPSVKSIETAIQQFANIPTAGMLSQLPGSFMSLAGMMNKMGDKNKKKIKDSLDPNLQESFESMTNLLQEPGASSDFVTDGRVDEETFINNAVELLSEAKSITDMVNAFDRLLYDTDLHGLDKLGEVEFTFEGAFGNVTQKMDSSGNITNNNSQAGEQAIQAFSSMLNSASQAAGASPGENLFSKQASTMIDMLGRMAPQAQKFRNQLLQKVNTSAEAQKFTKILDEGGRQGGNPLKYIT